MSLELITGPAGKPATPSLATPLRRRAFFRYAGASAGAAALALAGCKKDDPNPADSPVVFAKGDVGVLQYAYALEQLEAAFYAQVVRTPATDFSATELAYFTLVGQHEAIHRDSFRAIINRDFSGQLIADLAVNFSSIDFTKRASVLAAAQAFEDTGVAAYNGAAGLLQSAAYLTLAGKIVSVEARHAAYVRDLLYPGDANRFFAGDEQVDPATGLDRNPLKPAAVVAAIQPYVRQPLDASQLG